MTRTPQSNFFPRQVHPLCELGGSPPNNKNRGTPPSPLPVLEPYYSSLRRTDKYSSSPPASQQRYVKDKYNHRYASCRAKNEVACWLGKVSRIYYPP